MPNPAHIYVYGDIVNEQYNELQDQGYCSLTTVVQAINAQTDCDELIIHIHSRGGDVTEGFAIYDYLRSLNKPVTTIIDGLCASIATIIALAGDVRKIQPNSEFYIHNPWGYTGGDYANVQRYADELKRAEERILNFYITHTGADADILRSLMTNQTTLSAEQALQLGFANQIISRPRAYAMLTLNQNSNQLKNNKMNKALKLAQSIVNRLQGRHPVQNLSLMLDTGEPVFTDSEGPLPAVGDTLYLGEDNTAPIATAGSYVLTDGATLETDENGIILSVVPADNAADTAEIQALKQSVAGLQARIKTKEEAEQVLLKQLELIKAQMQSNYQPKPRQKEILNRHVPTERNRVADAAERRKEYKN